MQYINKIGTLQNRHNKLVFEVNKSLEIKQIRQIVNKKQEQAIGTLFDNTSRLYDSKRLLRKTTGTASDCTG